MGAVVVEVADDCVAGDVRSVGMGMVGRGGEPRMRVGKDDAGVRSGLGALAEDDDEVEALFLPGEVDE